MIRVIALCMFLIGCASAPVTQFNTDDKQDGSCYATMGGIRGYCDAIYEDQPTNGGSK